MYLLDTNVVSETRRKRPHGAVFEWLRSVPNSQLHICAMTVGEIQGGIEKTRDSDPLRAVEIENWLELVLRTYTVLPLDPAIMRVWARHVHRRSPDLYEDAMIAATALVNGLTIVTRNVPGFAPFKVTTLDPFKFGRTR